MDNASRTFAGIAVAAAVAALAPAAGAKKHDPQPTAADPAAVDACGYPAGTTVFEQFRDNKLYVPAPDGGFEADAAGWTLDGAAVVDGNETFQLGGADDAKSLSLPAGSSATSPDLCVAKGDPAFRFVARTDGGKRDRLRVEVLYRSGSGKPSRVAGKLRAGEEWKPTKKLAFALG